MQANMKGGRSSADFLHFRTGSKFILVDPMGGSGQLAFQHLHQQSLGGQSVAAWGRILERHALVRSA
jgi:hypothetical protein